MTNQWQLEQRDGELSLSINGIPINHLESAVYRFHPADDEGTKGTLEIVVGVDDIELVSDTPVDALLQANESALENLGTVKRLYEQAKSDYERLTKEMRAKA